VKALSLTQPWATLVVTGRKKVETRGWSTSIRERIAIHASKSMPAYAREAAIDFGLDPDALPLGAVLGTVSLMGCAPTHEVRHTLSAEELWFGDFADGRYAWFVYHPTAFDVPIPARGSLGFWNWTPPVKQEAHL
jgi:hypothetical protein